MRLITLFFLVIGSCVCLTLAQGIYEDCCLRYVRHLSKGIQRHAVKYRFQVPDGDCNLSAVIFKMRRGREFCTDPRETWVLDLMKKVDNKKLHREDKKRRHADRLSG
ncbi:C-C motif chemokine 25 [Cheilinus undulatus]|uniref:C-C motif chemokine 25 n=1 Tax=Cheilinus undulatus TaxID=241271 RepID=UPI001BD3432B|nr:C-C motif chemokine 25 [Cheilinus undulatus]